MWLIMAILSAFFAGITSILAKCGIKKTNSDLATALRTIVVLAFSWLMVAVVDSGGTISEIICVSDLIRRCHRRLLDLLFQSLSPGGCQ